MASMFDAILAEGDEDEDDSDRGDGGLGVPDQIEVARFVNEVHAELVVAARENVARREERDAIRARAALEHRDLTLDEARRLRELRPIRWQQAWSRGNEEDEDIEGQRCDLPVFDMTLLRPPRTAIRECRMVKEWTLEQCRDEKEMVVGTETTSAKVREVLKFRDASRGELAIATGCTQKQVSSSLTRMRRTGEATQDVRGGRWRLTGAEPRRIPTGPVGATPIEPAARRLQARDTEVIVRMMSERRNTLLLSVAQAQDELRRLEAAIGALAGAEPLQSTQEVPRAQQEAPH